MSKTEARQHFGSTYLYWHGAHHCWDATSTRRHSVQHRVQHRVHHHEPEPTRPAVIPMPSRDLRRSANAMVADEPGTDLIAATPWVERWIDIARVAPTKPVIVIERRPKPMVTPRDVIAVIMTIILLIALVEVMFGGMINERMRRRRHRGFAR